MPEDHKNTHLVVIGSSAGGIETLSRLVATLPGGGLDAPVVVAQQLALERESRLPEVLARRSRLPVRGVAEHARLEPGVVHVVPSNRHVKVAASAIDVRLDTRGRPKNSVGVLMSAAAGASGKGLIAVVLTGTGSDGTVNIQNSRTSEFGGMPGPLAPDTVDIVADLELVGPLLGGLLGRALSREREARQSIGGILESINDTFFALDHELRFTYLNGRAEAFFGKPRREVLGRTMSEALPEAEGSPAYESIVEALRSGEPAGFEAPMPVTGAWISARVYPTSEGVSVFFEDVSERKRTEERLRGSEERFRLMADAVPQIVWLTDPDGQTEFFNRQWTAYTGAPYEPTTAAKVTENYVHRDDRGATMEAFDEEPLGRAPAPGHRGRPGDGAQAPPQGRRAVRHPRRPPRERRRGCHSGPRAQPDLPRAARGGPQRGLPLGLRLALRWPRHRAGEGGGNRGGRRPRLRRLRRQRGRGPAVHEGARRAARRRPQAGLRAGPGHAGRGLRPAGGDADG